MYSYEERLSNFDKARGIIGHECMNELLVKIRFAVLLEIITYSLGGTDMETRDILKNLREKNKLTKSHLNGTTK